MADDTQPAPPQSPSVSWGNMMIPPSVALPALKAGIPQRSGIPVASPTPPFYALWFHPRDWKQSWGFGLLRRNDRGVVQSRTGTDKAELHQWLAAESLKGKGFGILQDVNSGQFWAYTSKQCPEVTLIETLYKHWTDYRSRDLRKPGDRYNYDEKTRRFQKKAVNTGAWDWMYEVEKAEDRGLLGSKPQ